MKVILLRDIRKIGKKWDVKEVNDGYARNFLFPKKLVLPATAENISKRKKKIEQEKSELSHLKDVADKLTEENFTFYIKTGKNGEIFNSIKEIDIKKKISEMGYKEIKKIEMTKPIKEIGEREFVAELGQGVKTRFKLRILPSQNA